jgi:hypothetical protein
MWLGGSANPGRAVFLSAVDLLIEHGDLNDPDVAPISDSLGAVPTQKDVGPPQIHGGKGLTLEVRVLSRARELLGSDKALAHELRVTVPDLLLLLAGVQRPTRWVFLAAVDILIAHNDIDGLSAMHSVPSEHIDVPDCMSAPVPPDSGVGK